MKVRYISGILILIAGQLLWPELGRADSWQQALTSRVSTEFDSNPSIAPGSTVGVWRALFDPSYTLVGREGLNDLKVGISAQFAHSSNQSLSPNRKSPSAYFNWQRPTESGEFGLTTRYVELATRDASGADGTGLVPSSSTRSSRTLSGTWTRDLDERFTASADGGYEKTTYNGGVFTDYSTRSAGLKLSYNYNDKISPYVRVSGNKYIPINGGPSSNLADAVFGTVWKAEYIDWTMQIGKSRIAFENSDNQGLLMANYAGPRSKLTLSAARTITPSGLGGFVKADLFTENWIYQLSEYSSTGIDLQKRKNYFSTTTPFGTNTTAGVWLEHNLTSLWGVRTYLNHRTFESEGASVASSNILGLSLTYDNPNF